MSQAPSPGIERQRRVASNASRSDRLLPQKQGRLFLGRPRAFGADHGTTYSLVKRGERAAGM